MTSLSSTSTLAEIKAAYKDNADYDIIGDVTKCGVFVQACRMLLLDMADQVQRGDHLMRQEYRRCELALTRAEKWLDRQQVLTSDVSRDRFMRVRPL